MNIARSMWLVAGVGVVALALVTALAVVAAKADEDRCNAAGGRMVCHSSTMTGIDGKGRPTVGTITDCRCLRADGSEVVP